MRRLELVPTNQLATSFVMPAEYSTLKKLWLLAKEQKAATAVLAGH